MALPDHYRCDVCGLRFVLTLEPLIMCATHGEDDHCHVGEFLLCDDGRTQRAAQSPECITFATSEWTE